LSQFRSVKGDTPSIFAAALILINPDPSVLFIVAKL